MNRPKATPARAAALLVAALLLSSCDNPANEAGAALYREHCQACHGADGQGFKNLYPPLAGSGYLRGAPGELICLITNGVRGDIITADGDYNVLMPAITRLDDAQLSDLVGYLSDRWAVADKTSNPLSPAAVAAFRKACAP
jgi:mono/diheme cytochrome c family protein